MDDLHFSADQEEQLRRSAEAAAENEFQKINEELDKQILFVLVGEVNTGKSSTVNKLIGEDVASVDVQPGETVVIGSYIQNGVDKIVYVDTPGLNDSETGNSKVTLDYVKNADVLLYFLNAAGAVFSETDQKNFDRLTKANNNVVLVLNKIDASDNFEKQIGFIKDKTNGKYDIVPISSKTGQNIDILREKILDILEKKHKDLLFAKSIKEKSATANRWINAASVSAAGLGLAPIPGSDIVPITAVQVGMLLRLASLYDKPMSKESAKELVISTLVGNMGKTVFRQLIKLIPGAGSLAGAGVAGTLTFALGHSVKYCYENNINVNYKALKGLVGKYKNRATEEAAPTSE